MQKIRVNYIGLQTACCADGIVKDSVEVHCRLLIVTKLTAHGQPRYLGGQIHRCATSKQQVAPSFCISVPCTQRNDVTDAHQREHGSCSIQCSLQHESSCQLYQHVTYEQVQFPAQNGVSYSLYLAAYASLKQFIGSSISRWVTCISPSVRFGFAKAPLKVCKKVIASIVQLRCAWVKLSLLVATSLKHVCWALLLWPCVRGGSSLSCDASRVAVLGQLCQRHSKGTNPRV